MLRLRRSLGHTQTSKKTAKKQIFVEKPVTAELALTSQKYLQILLFKAEADWAYAMQMKQQASNLSGKSSAAANVSKLSGNRTNVNRLKVHYLRRFKRAFQGAKRLREVCEHAVDEPSLFELEAYEEQMEAIFLMEVLKFEEALDHLLKAKVIYEKMSEYKATLDALIYGEKVSQITTFIR